ncbi:MAG TPA: hypothetical protein VG370_30725 [Chloroflexota bacterium]|jgi:hypothetical protein|nr:hypothetical protein [Chloroflexota bacterium]
MARGYTERQLASVMRASGATSWQDALDYLAGHVDGLPDVDRSEIHAMRDDLEEMKRRGEPFTLDARMLYGTIVAIRGVRTS